MPDANAYDANDVKIPGQVPPCSLRGNGCPFGDFCYTSRSETYGFYPTIQDLRKGEYLWSYSTASGLVTIVESGLMAALILYSEEGEEIPFGVYSRGIVSGLIEMGNDDHVIDMAYSMRALSPARVCKIPRKMMRSLLRQHPRLLHDALAQAALDQASASATMTVILSRKSIYDKIKMLLKLFDALSEKDERLDRCLKLTHGDLAYLISADRVSVTRALAKMQDEGIVNVGYRRVLRGSDSDLSGDAPMFMKGASLKGKQ